jgi:hypothetical protein
MQRQEDERRSQLLMQQQQMDSRKRARPTKSSELDSSLWLKVHVVCSVQM